MTARSPYSFGSYAGEPALPSELLEQFVNTRGGGAVQQLTVKAIYTDSRNRIVGTVEDEQGSRKVYRIGRTEAGTGIWDNLPRK